MKHLDLHGRLEVSHYLWGKEEFAKEIRNGFPLLSRSFQFGIVPRLLLFLKSMAQVDQLEYATTLARRRNPEALRLLGEAFTNRDKERFEQCARAIQVPTPAESEAADGFTSGEGNGVRQTKQLLRQAISKELVTLLGEPHQRRTGTWWVYRTELGGCIVETEVDIGGHHHMLNYCHNLKLASGSCLKGHFSLLSLLGISGQADWEEREDPRAVAKGLTLLYHEYIGGVSEILAHANLGS